MSENKTILSEMHSHGLIRSFAEGRRLVFGGGISVNGEKIEDVNEHLCNGDTVQVGRRHTFVVGESKDSVEE